MSTTYERTMKRHDTGPPVRGRIINKSNGQPEDMTGGSVLFLMYSIDPVTGELTEVVNAAGVVESPGADGRVRYDWSAGDTDVDPARYLALFEATTAAGRKESYPTEGYMHINIEEDLNDG